MTSLSEKGNNVQPILKAHLDGLTVWGALKVYRRLTIICALASFSAVCDGFQGHFNGSIVANKGFIRQFSDGGTKLDPYWVSVWGGTGSAAGCFAPFVIPFINDAFGRKVGLWCTLVLLTASTLAESFVTNNVGWLFAKILSGIGIAAMQATLPMYLAEQSPPQLRGLFTQSYTLSYVVGQLLSSVPLNSYSISDPYNFRSPIYVQFAVIGLLYPIYAFIPESPWYYLQKGKVDAARKQLLKYRGHVDGYDVEEHIAVMLNTIDVERESKRSQSMFNLDIFRGTNGFRLMIALWPKLLQQVCGLSLFNTYATYFFNIAGYSNAFEISVILSCVQIISMILTMGLVDVWGRRPMTVYGYLITILSDFALGATGFYNLTNNPTVAGLIVFFACLATFSTTSASAIGYAYLAEMPKQDLRAKSAGWGLALSGLIGIVFSYCTPLMINLWVQKTGFFFGCAGLCFWVVAWFIMPEVSQRVPAEIDEMFEKKIAPRKFKGYVTDVQLRLAEQEREQGLEVTQPTHTA